jgi:hypothetical protein
MTVTMPHPSNAPRRAPRNTREPISVTDLCERLTLAQRDLSDISEELKSLNADHYLPSSVQPLVIAAVRQSGFAAEHLSNALLVLSATQQKEAAQ